MGKMVSWLAPTVKRGWHVPGTAHGISTQRMEVRSTMLFRTVYGPELEAIHRYVVDRNNQGIRPRRADVHTAFVPRRRDGSFTQNVDDALAFLRSAHLIEQANGYHTVGTMDGLPFAVQVLLAIRRIEREEESPDHPVDSLYTLLLTELFIKPDRLFVQDAHAEANRLCAVEAAGGLSREKIGAWKRVMEFLGVGRRVAGGFLCAYSPALVAAILMQWNRSRGTLQSFLQDCFDPVLPYARADSDLSQAVMAPLSYLVAQGQIELFPLQDSPTRSYFGHHRCKGIARR